LENAWNKEDRLKAEQEPAEIFWKDLNLAKPHSTLDTVYDVGILGLKIQYLFDEKKELKLCAELIDKYHLRQMDAMLLMQAHSSGCDFFLTWDGRLIRKAKRAAWLKPKAITPATFLHHG